MTSIKPLDTGGLIKQISNKLKTEKMKADEIKRLNVWLQGLDNVSSSLKEYSEYLNKSLSDDLALDWIHSLEVIGVIFRYKNGEWQLPNKYYMKYNDIRRTGFGTLSNANITDQGIINKLKEINFDFENCFIERKPFKDYLFDSIELIERARATNYDKEPIPLIIREEYKKRKLQQSLDSKKRSARILKEKEAKIKEDKAKKELSKELSRYSDDVLSDELKSRGYKGNLIYKKEIKI